MGLVTKVLFVDDHKIIRVAMSNFLNRKAKVDILEANNGVEGASLFFEHQVHIVITDIKMPEMDGIEMVKRIRKENKEVMIIAFTMFDDPINIKSILSAGANSYVLKGDHPDDLINAIELAKNGESYFSEKVSKIVMASLTQSLKIRNNSLSKREMEVLELTLMEKSNQEIADALFISFRTVEVHKHNIMKKTDAKSLVGLVKYALRNKLFEHVFYDAV